MEMEVLVARVALYPDELVAAIAAASLHPLQIVQAERYLERVKTQPELKLDKDWDGSVVSLMNYPEIVKMMSDDLDWTQQLGEAVTNQQKDMLAAIQQLRENAVADGIIKSDNKTVVVREHDNVIIKPAQADKVYIPVYRSEALYDSSYASRRDSTYSSGRDSTYGSEYDSGYASEGVSYGSESYSSYYDPTAAYYAAYVTGAAWAAAVDWEEGETWSGYGDWAKNVNLTCNYCVNGGNFNGNLSLSQVDWTKVDASRTSFDKSQLTKLDQNTLLGDLKADRGNSLVKRAGDLAPPRAETPPQQQPLGDVGGSVLEGLKSANLGGRFGGIGNALGRFDKPLAAKPKMPGATAKPPAGSGPKPMAGKPKPPARVGAGPRPLAQHGPRRPGPGAGGGRPQFRPPVRGPGGFAGAPRFGGPPGPGRPPMPPPGGPPGL
jgi:hypothetical protein